MIGEGAVEMSGSFVQLLEMAAKEEDIKFPNYAHPGLNEGLLESVEGLIGQAIMPRRLNEESCVPLNAAHNLNRKTIQTICGFINTK